MKRAFYLVCLILPNLALASQDEHGTSGVHHTTKELEQAHQYQCISEKDPTHIFSISQNAGEETGIFIMGDEQKDVLVFSGLTTVSFVHLTNDASINLSVHLDTGKFEVSYGGALFGEEHGICTQPPA